MQFCSYCQQVSIKPNFLKIRAELTEIWLIEFSNFGTPQLPTYGRTPLISPSTQQGSGWATPPHPKKKPGLFPVVFSFTFCSVEFVHNFLMKTFMFPIIYEYVHFGSAISFNNPYIFLSLYIFSATCKQRKKTLS